MPTRVLLVEDSDVYRSSLELLLQLEDGIEVVGAVATGREAVAQVPTSRPDVAVVDLRLPGLDGVATTAALRSASPAVTVVCLTAEATAEEREAVLRAGAVAVVEKAQPIRALADLLRTATGNPDSTI